MACSVKFFSGFEGGSLGVSLYTEGLQILSGTSSIVTSPVYAGARALRCNPTGAALGHGRVSPPGGDGELQGNFNAKEVFGCFRFRVATLPGSGYEHVLRIYNTGTEGMRISINSSGYLELRDGSENVLGTASSPLSVNTWYLIEFKQRKSDESYELKVDKVSEVSGTIGAGWPDILVNYIYVGKSENHSSQSVDFYYDDLVLCIGDYLPQPYSIDVGSPTGDGYYGSWSHDYTYVDDIPPDGDTTYRHSATEGAMATQTRDAPSGTGVIAAVMASFCARRVYPSYVKTLLRSNGTNKQATDARVLSTAYNLNLCQVEETDFGRSDIPWTDANVGTLEFGLEHTSGVTGEGSMWTSAVLCVLYCAEVAGTKVYYDLGG